MDFRYNILHLILLLFCQFTISNAKTLSVNSHLLNGDSGNREKFTIEFSKLNFEEDEQTFDHPLKSEIARRFRRALKAANPTKTKVNFYNYSFEKFPLYPTQKVHKPHVVMEKKLLSRPRLRYSKT